MSIPSDPAPDPSNPRSGTRRWPLVLALLLVVVAASWYAWRQRSEHEKALADDAHAQIDALSQRLTAVRSEQRAQSRRLQRADSLNRVLRDELDGIGQRAALLEDSVNRLADPDRHGAQALRLDETELLLTLGAQRLQVAGDLDGARRAYALASGVLEGIDDPAYLSLRQTLQQERAALDALGADPKVQAVARLDVFAQRVTAPAGAETVPRLGRDPWWERAFGRLLRVQATDRAVAVQPADRAAALAGLQLEISLARVAAERRDVAGYRAALTRADAWLLRLAPDSAARAQHRAELRALATLPLDATLPTLGSTLTQLRQLRAR